MTIAQQLKIKDFPFVIRDNNGKVIYFEDSDGYSWKYEYDDNGKETYFEDSNGYSWKREYDDNGKETYFEDSNGVVRDNRPKPQIELTKQEIADKFGIDINLLTIKP